MTAVDPHVRAARVIRLVGWLTLLIGAASVVSVFYPSWSAGTPLPPAFWVIALLLVGLPVAMLVIARGLFAQRPWARSAAIVYGVLALFGFPVGTMIGVYVLWQLRKGWPVDSPAYQSPWAAK